MNRLRTLARLEAKHDVQQARHRKEFLNEYVRELRVVLLELDERDARYLAETGREWESPPQTPEQDEHFRLTLELIDEWKATQKR